ncbi:AraC family transcriptional regulator [Bernardetia sp. MNP-M8]|uniref:AraC family transcriptional regulator n=1 Tax=Bernardetia sp. MNP-M8 TaxID=3127470 RepID=UPI0030D4B967
MNISKIERIKLQSLDNLELFSTYNSNQDFPLHYHETFCISSIEKGAFIENDKIALQNSLLISNPLEIHKNSAFQNLDYSIKTLYISKDIFKFALGKNKVNDDFLLQNLITDTFLFNKFNQLSNQIVAYKKNDFGDSFENQFIGFIQEIGQYESSKKNKTTATNITQTPTWLNDTKQYLIANLDQKISLEALANQTKLDKFQFIRAFKKYVGLTPFQYILLSRISLAKQLLQEGNSITETALDAGFYDQSNFANYFKNYVGVTPRNYQQSFNILQD